MLDNLINEFENAPITVIGVKTIDAFTDELGNVHLILGERVSTPPPSVNPPRMLVSGWYNLGIWDIYGNKLVNINGDSDEAVDGSFAAAKVRYINGWCLDSVEDVYFIDTPSGSGDALVRRMSFTGQTTGTITTLATINPDEFDEGCPLNLYGIEVIGDNLYIVDGWYTVIWMLPKVGGKFTKFAGNKYAAPFSLPFGMTKDSSGNLYVADTSNSAIMKINSLGNVSIFTNDVEMFYNISSLTSDTEGNIYGDARPFGSYYTGLSKTNSLGLSTMLVSPDEEHMGVSVNYHSLSYYSELNQIYVAYGFTPWEINVYNMSGTFIESIVLSDSPGSPQRNILVIPGFI